MLLITGITGLTGRFLFQEIKEKLPDQKIRYLVRSTSNHKWLQSEDIFFGDVTNQQDIEHALDGVTSVVHLAHIHHSENITRACMNQNVKRVFFINTTGMFSQHKKYAKDYISLEERIKESKLIYTIIRPTMIYGNQQDVNIHKLIKLMDKYPVFPVIGDGKGLMQPIYAEDLAKVIIQACLNEELTRYKEYNVAGKAPLAYKQILSEISIVLNKKVYFFHIPFTFALLAGIIGDIIPNGIIDYEKVKRLREDKHFDYSLASKELGFNPRAFSEGVKLEVEALRENGMIKG